MFWNLLLATTLLAADAPQAATQPPEAPADALESVIAVPRLADSAKLSYMLQDWKGGAKLYQRLVDANPTVGLYWYRLGHCLLESGRYEEAIGALEKSEELGGFGWEIPIAITFRGESAFGVAAAHARLGHRDEAIRWTKKSLSQGLREIRRFHGPHFQALLDDPEFRELVWYSDPAADKSLSRDEKFRRDLRFVVHEGKRIHYAPFRRTPEAEIDAQTKSLDTEIPNLTDDQVFVRMRGIIALLGDGHTAVLQNKIAMLPVSFFWLPEGLHIISALSPHGDLVGARVLKFGETTADEALRRSQTIASSDNAMNLQARAADQLRSMVVLRGLGIVAPEGPVKLEIEDAQGSTRLVELEPRDKQANRKDWLQQVPGCETPLPLALRMRSQLYSFERISDQRLIYCQINALANDPKESLKDFCTRLFRAVAEPEVDALVLDLRFNGGGNTFLNPPLVDGLVSSEKLRKPGSLFVIIGRGTFSAAQNTSTDIERRTGAIFVGEPTGSRPNFIGENVMVPLKHTGWALSVSDLWWQHSSAQDYRTWIPPQLYAPPTAAALKAHRDPALEVIERYRASLQPAKS